ncbi:MAG: adenylate/guanylate cyclase domain-containing protein [Ginsengibacter sp.]
MYLFQKDKIKNIGKDWSEHVKFYIAGWFFASILFYVMRQVGVSGLSHQNFSILQSVLLIPVFSIVFGITFGTLLYLFEKYLFRKIPLWKLMLRLIIDQLLIICLCVSVYYSVTKLMKLNTHAFWDFVESPATFIFALYVFLVNSFISFFWEVTRLLGRGNFIKLITGKFYTPKEEYRIFMFADLKSSTTIAEKLGHILYSSFIKDCFYDLAVVHQYGAEIYQYVGDEAVLTWEYSKMKNISECIEAFWDFNDTLEKRSEYYKNTYGILPYFKAGMNIGMVTVVEIGDLKKEIAYHGNAINTASRIEALCNSFNEKLLVSKKLYDLIANESSSYTFEKVTETQLRGKQGITEIYCVKRPANVPIDV